MSKIDDAIVQRLIETREQTITSAGLVVVPGYETEPDGINAWVKRSRINLRRLSRQNVNKGADCAILTVTYTLVITEKATADSQYAVGVHLARLIEKLTEVALVDAATSHVVTLDVEQSDDVPAPDDQRGMAVRTVTVSGVVQRGGTGTGLSAIPEQEIDP